ncbi:putative scytalone dehydratase [Cyphellophora attinorum]|uniref:Putative scytalone dehydratase n=1 Tax=Cyphellophora attinorum TaxID=1664694 RepID=A0A0N1HT24_9EURO|nr:putative scytalone dehydratase [Phialophora attinorum]KPI41985.1 putative scytalone dehydratase [Phialophora attinorum]
MALRPSGRVDPADAFEVQALTFEWAMSYDTKDWNRLKAILAPKLNIDYTDVDGTTFDNIPPEKWIEHCSNPRFLGGNRMSTQHFIGAAKYVQLTPNEIQADYQIRAAHVRWMDDARTVEGPKGHGHGLMRQNYIKIDGAWRLAGWRPIVLWNEHDFGEVVRFGLEQPVEKL